MENSLNLNITINQGIDKLRKFIESPQYLPRWTVHRAVFFKDNNWFEVRHLDGQLVDASLQITSQADGNIRFLVIFQWEFPNKHAYQVVFVLQKLDSLQTVVSTRLPSHLPAERLVKMRQVIQAELEILKAIHENRLDQIPNAYWHLLQSYHLSLYQ